MVKVVYIILLQNVEHVEELIQEFHGHKSRLVPSITWKYPSVLLQGDGSIR